jgi:hypothetical protein
VCVCARDVKDRNGENFQFGFNGLKASSSALNWVECFCDVICGGGSALGITVNLKFKFLSTHFQRHLTEILQSS